MWSKKGNLLNVLFIITERKVKKLYNEFSKNAHRRIITAFAKTQI